MFEVFKKSFSVTVGVLSGITVVGVVGNLITNLAENKINTKDEPENKSSEEVETL